MKLSIITPSYNQGRFLKDCIDSVLLQTEVEHEHIIIDACSTDETLEILKANPHLIWSSEKDGGMSDGINKGFAKATGDWLMWLNCDDFLLPGALKKVVDFIQANPDADIVHGDCQYIEEDKTLIRRKYDTQIDEWDLLFVGCIIPSTSAFYRREIIDAKEVLDISYKNCMDWEYYLRLFRKGYKFKYIPELLASFRWYDDSTTSQNWERMISEGLQARREHIKIRNLPKILKNQQLLRLLRRVFQCRRVAKRLLTYGRIR